MEVNTIDNNIELKLGIGLHILFVKVHDTDFVCGVVNVLKNLSLVSMATKNVYVFEEIL